MIDMRLQRLSTIVVIYGDGFRHWKGGIEFRVIVTAGCVNSE